MALNNDQRNKQRLGSTLQSIRETLKEFMDWLIKHQRIAARQHDLIEAGKLSDMRSFIMEYPGRRCVIDIAPENEKIYENLLKNLGMDHYIYNPSDKRDPSFPEAKHEYDAQGKTVIGIDVDDEEIIHKYELFRNCLAEYDRWYERGIAKGFDQALSERIPLDFMTNPLFHNGKLSLYKEREQYLEKTFLDFCKEHNIDPQKLLDGGYGHSERNDIKERTDDTEIPSYNSKKADIEKDHDKKSFTLLDDINALNAASDGRKRSEKGLDAIEEEKEAVVRVLNGKNHDKSEKGRSSTLSDDLNNLTRSEKGVNALKDLDAQKKTDSEKSGEGAEHADDRSGAEDEKKKTSSEESRTSEDNKQSENSTRSLKNDIKELQNEQDKKEDVKEGEKSDKAGSSKNDEGEEPVDTVKNDNGVNKERSDSNKENKDIEHEADNEDNIIVPPIPDAEDSSSVKIEFKNKTADHDVVSETGMSSSDIDETPVLSEAVSDEIIREDNHSETESSDILNSDTSERNGDIFTKQENLEEYNDVKDESDNANKASDNAELKFEKGVKALDETTSSAIVQDDSSVQFVNVYDSETNTIHRDSVESLSGGYIKITDPDGDTIAFMQTMNGPDDPVGTMQLTDDAYEDLSFQDPDGTVHTHDDPDMEKLIQEGADNGEKFSEIDEAERQNSESVQNEIEDSVWVYHVEDNTIHQESKEVLKNGYDTLYSPDGEQFLGYIPHESKDETAGAETAVKEKSDENRTAEIPVAGVAPGHEVRLDQDRYGSITIFDNSNNNYSIEKYLREVSEGEENKNDSSDLFIDNKNNAIASGFSEAPSIGIGSSSQSVVFNGSQSDHLALERSLVEFTGIKSEVNSSSIGRAARDVFGSTRGMNAFYDMVLAGAGGKQFWIDQGNFNKKTFMNDTDSLEMINDLLGLKGDARYSLDSFSSAEKTEAFTNQFNQFLSKNGVISDSILGKNASGMKRLDVNSMMKKVSVEDGKEAVLFDVFGGNISTKLKAQRVNGKQKWSDAQINKFKIGLAGGYVDHMGKMSVQEYKFVSAKDMEGINTGLNELIKKSARAGGAPTSFSGSWGKFIASNIGSYAREDAVANEMTQFTAHIEHAKTTVNTVKYGANLLNEFKTQSYIKRIDRVNSVLSKHFDPANEFRLTQKELLKQKKELRKLQQSQKNWQRFAGNVKNGRLNRWSGKAVNALGGKNTMAWSFANRLGSGIKSTQMAAFNRLSTTRAGQFMSRVGNSRAVTFLRSVKILNPVGKIIGKIASKLISLKSMAEKMLRKFLLGFMKLFFRFYAAYLYVCFKLMLLFFPIIMVLMLVTALTTGEASGAELNQPYIDGAVTVTGSKDTSSDPHDYTEATLGKVYDSLCTEEKEWIRELATGEYVTGTPNVSDYHYVDIDNLSNPDAWDYTAEEFAKTILHTDYDSSKGIKGPEPFPNAPDAAYKWISVIDGGSSLQFRNKKGEYTTESNIKDIVCMTMTVNESNDAPEDENENGWFGQSIEHIKNAKGFYGKMFAVYEMGFSAVSHTASGIKNMFVDFASKIHGLGKLVVDLDNSITSTLRSRVYLMYAQPLFNKSHFTAFSLKMVVLPTKWTNDKTAALSDWYASSYTYGGSDYGPFVTSVFDNKGVENLSGYVLEDGNNTPVELFMITISGEGGTNAAGHGACDIRKDKGYDYTYPHGIAAGLDFDYSVANFINFCLNKDPGFYGSAFNEWKGYTGKFRYSLHGDDQTKALRERVGNAYLSCYHKDPDKVTSDLYTYYKKNYFDNNGGMYQQCLNKGIDLTKYPVAISAALLSGSIYAGSGNTKLTAGLSPSMSDAEMLQQVYNNIWNAKGRKASGDSPKSGIYKRFNPQSGSEIELAKQMLVGRNASQSYQGKANQWKGISSFYLRDPESHKIEVNNLVAVEEDTTKAQLMMIRNTFSRYTNMSKDSAVMTAYAGENDTDKESSDDTDDRKNMTIKERNIRNYAFHIDEYLKGISDQGNLMSTLNQHYDDTDDPDFLPYDTLHSLTDASQSKLQKDIRKQIEALSKTTEDAVVEDKEVDYIGSISDGDSKSEITYTIVIPGRYEKPEKKEENGTSQGDKIASVDESTSAGDQDVSESSYFADYTRNGQDLANTVLGEHMCTADFGCMHYQGFYYGDWDNQTGLYYRPGYTAGSYNEGDYLYQVAPGWLGDYAAFQNDPLHYGSCIPDPNNRAYDFYRTLDAHSSCWTYSAGEPDTHSGRFSGDNTDEHNSSVIQGIYPDNEGYKVSNANGTKDTVTVEVCTDTDYDDPDDDDEYTSVKVTFTRKCNGQHVGYYCGGHLQLQTVAVVLNFTQDEIDNKHEKYVQKTDTEEWLTVDEPEELVMHMFDNGGIIDDLKGWLSSTFGASDNGLVDDDELNRAEDIFDVDMSIIHIPGTYAINFEGWNYDNMDTACSMWNDNWKDLYGIDTSLQNLMDILKNTEGASYDVGYISSQGSTSLTDAAVKVDPSKLIVPNDYMEERRNDKGCLPVIMYYQGYTEQAPWEYAPLCADRPDKTFRSSGCGPTSVAMALTYFNCGADISNERELITPARLMQEAALHGYKYKDLFLEGSGISYSSFNKLCNLYGCKAVEMSATETNMKQQLAKGRPLLISVTGGKYKRNSKSGASTLNSSWNGTSQGLFTGGAGHIILVTGYITDDSSPHRGEFTINNPGMPSAQQWSKSYLPNQLLAEMKGGHFWSVMKMDETP